jgi:AraC family transcriptional regulator
MRLANEAGSGWEVRRELAGLALSESAYAPRLRQPRHAHAPASFSLVLEGGYSETVARRTFECRPATLVFRPPAETHSVAFHAAPVRIFRLDLGSQWLERLGVSTTRAQAAAATGGFRSWLALRLYREFCEADEFSPLAAEGLALELWAETARAAARQRDRRSPRWIERARDLLREQSPSGAPTLAEIAREVGVHPSRLAHQFRRSYGVTAGEYLRGLRVERAARALAGSNLSLSEIATAAGFYDQSHMTNAFRRATGSTPAEYRAAFRPAQSRPN